MRHRVGKPAKEGSRADRWVVKKRRLGPGGRHAGRRHHGGQEGARGWSGPDESARIEGRGGECGRGGKILLDNWEFEPIANVLVAFGSGGAGTGAHAEVNVGPVACLGARQHWERNTIN